MLFSKEGHQPHIRQFLWVYNKNGFVCNYANVWIFYEFQYTIKSSHLYTPVHRTICWAFSLVRLPQPSVCHSLQSKPANQTNWWWVYATKRIKKKTKKKVKICFDYWIVEVINFKLKCWMLIYLGEVFVESLNARRQTTDKGTYPTALNKRLNKKK